MVVSQGDEANENNNRVVPVGEASTAVVSSLSPHTVYTFQIISENLAGKSLPGESSAPVRTKGEREILRYCGFFF